MIDLQMDFATELKRRRKEKGWSQAQLAIKAGIKAHNIGAYEEGRAEPRLQKFISICRALGINDILIFN